uniref:SEA domain-containing protein n=1 Tax=Timema tahoe TaxID=61484 RepID=A0A7R9NXI8_9NEOP|nr:unnamed protein product [Timema tahoe]
MSVEGNDLVVHFNVHFDPRWLRVQTSDLFTVLSNEIILEEPMYLANLTIDPNSIDVKESSAALTTQQPLSSITAVTLSPPTTVQPVPRRCGPVQLEYCNKLLYNSTSYPNKLGHNNLQEVLDNVIAFRMDECTFTMKGPPWTIPVFKKGRERVNLGLHLK